ncbi:MAG TPA: YHS domain-containing protein [Nitrososphaera sp.]
MATNPVCGMFVEEKPDPIQHTVDGRKYYFCSTQCLNEFTESERELKRLKRHVAISIALTIPIVILTLPHMFPEQLGELMVLPMREASLIGWH